MNKIEIKAVFFDIDGTLVSFETHQVPQSTIEALDALRKKGIKVVIATGRPLHDINNLGDLEFDGYITANGAYCVTKDKELLHSNLISTESKEKLLEYLKINPFPCLFVTEGESFLNYIDEQVISINKMVNLPAPAIAPVERVLECDIFQIDAFIDAKEEKFLIDNILTDCEGNRWHPAFVDLNVKGNNKATGIEAFLKHYNIKQEQTMAFGDGGNDISMLEYVALGVAMGNANDEVKAKADFVTLSVDNQGISHALKHFDIV